MEGARVGAILGQGLGQGQLSPAVGSVFASAKESVSRLGAARAASAEATLGEVPWEPLSGQGKAYPPWKGSDRSSLPGDRWPRPEASEGSWPGSVTCPSIGATAPPSRQAIAPRLSPRGRRLHRILQRADRELRFFLSNLRDARLYLGAEPFAPSRRKRRNSPPGCLGASRG